MLSLCLALLETARLCCKVLGPFYTPTNDTQGSRCPTSSPALGMVSLFNFSHSNRCVQCDLTAILIRISLMTNNVDHVFGEPSPPFSIELSSRCKKPLYIPHTSFLPDVRVVTISSRSVIRLSVFSMAFFEEQSFKNVVKYDSPILFTLFVS